MSEGVLLEPPAPPRPKTPTISERTLVPFSMVAGIMAVFMGATWWLRGALADITNAQERTNEKISRIEASMAVASQDNVREADLQIFLARLARQNPTLTVPDWTR